MSGPNEATRVTVPAACVGVIEHDATPRVFVLAVHVSPTPSVKVIALPAIGAPPSGSVKVADARYGSW